MGEKKSNQKVWDRYAKWYDFEIERFNKKAYRQMYTEINGALNKNMNVLEVATGTGLIALNVAESANKVEAIDFSKEMIKKALKKENPYDVHFSVADATNLPFESMTFDVVIIANALHIMPEPELALANIKRVLKPKGILIAPCFSQGHVSDLSWWISVRVLRMFGFETYAKLTPEEYVSFIEKNGFIVTKWQILQAGFPLVYLEARMED